MEETNEYLPFFMYGSLRVGAVRYKLVRSYVKSFHPGWLDGFQMYDFGPFPGIVSGPVDRPIVGDIIHIHLEQWEQCISALDRYENNGFLFQRERFQVRDDFGGARCWVYLARTEALQVEPSMLVRSNDWMVRE